MAVVDTIYGEFRDAVEVLQKAGQISLQIMLESNLRKTLLLSAASYFEVQLTREVQSFTDEVASGNDLIRSLVQQKAISRQYHAWFDWDKSNANKFFGLFGATFKDHMIAVLKKSPENAESIKAFLTIGNERNLLVHSDYASYYIDRTPDEIYALYQSANRFVVSIGNELRACSANNSAAAIDPTNNAEGGL
jgi:hypothetical protein